VLQVIHVVAQEYPDKLAEFGFADHVPTSRVAVFPEFLETETPAVVVLNVN